MKNEITNIVQVVNCYDKLYYTGKDFSNHSLNRENILDYIKSNAGIIFSKFAAELLCTYVSKYEVGNKVLLNNNKKAEVIKHTCNANNPIIKLLDTEEIINLNLSEDLFIKEVIVNKEGEYNGSKGNSEIYNYL
jgi:hypothetical protein